MSIAVVGNGPWGAAMAKVGGIRSVPTAHRALSRAGVEAVIVDSPIGSRPKHITAAVQAGKHVMVRGPLADTATRAESVIEAVRAAGVKIAVVHDAAHDPAYQQAVAQLSSGKIGSPGFFKIHVECPTPKEKGDGGLLWGSLIHELDWVQHHLGAIKGVFAQGVTQGGKSPLEYTMATLTLKSGAIGQVIGSRRPGVEPRTRFEICGKTGMIQFDTGEQPIETRTPRRRTASPLSNDIPRQQWEAFQVLLASGSTGLKAARQSLNALRVAKAMEQSIKTGKSVAVGRAHS